MSDWQIIDSDQIIKSGSEQPVRPRLHRPWLYVAGAIFILAVVGIGIVYRQRLQRQAAIEEDLNAFILEEESLRFLGHFDRITELIIPAAPPGWQQRYQQTFHTNASQPPEITLNEFDFDGECVIANVSLNGDKGVRNYCLVDGRWRRAPVLSTVGGYEKNEITLANGSRLIFQPRDEIFATGLADNLPRLIGQLDPWLLPDKPFDIVIEPRDLEVPLISVEGAAIVLNSPLLIPADSRVPSTQAKVQAALVNAILRRGGAIPSDMPAGLPGANRFLEAAQMVIAINLLLDTESRASLVANWQTQLDGQWVSPFFGGSFAAESLDTTQSDLAAYLTAEYIYRTEGLDTLMELLSRLPTADSWDTLFGNVLNQSTVAVENQTAANFQLGKNLEVSASTSDLPVEGTLLAASSQPDGGFRTYIIQPDTDQPLWVEVSPGLSFVSANGTSLPAECVLPGADLHIKGQWLETGRRVQASQVTVQDVSLLSIKAAPSDAIAYVIEGQPPSDIDLLVNNIFPSNRLFFAPNELITPQALVAVREDGTLQELTPLSADLQIVSLPVAANKKPHFMFILDLPGCEQRWFVHYQPEQGITGQWLAPPPPMNWLWQADQESLLFFDSKPGGAGHNIYKAESLAYRPVGKSNMLVSFAGWKVDTSQLVFIRRDWGGAFGIGLLEPVSGKVRRAKIYVYPLHARRLSPDGQWLAFLTGAKNRIDPPYRLELLNLNTLAETTAIQVESDQAIGRAVWSPYLDNPKLAALSGPLVWEDVLRPNRLLVTSSERPESLEVVAEVEAGVKQLAAPVFCADGSLLYRIDEGDQHQLVHQSPGGAAEVILTSNQLFKPIACP